MFGWSIEKHRSLMREILTQGTFHEVQHPVDYSKIPMKQNFIQDL